MKLFAVEQDFPRKLWDMSKCWGKKIFSFLIGENELRQTKVENIWGLGVFQESGEKEHMGVEQPEKAGIWGGGWNTIVRRWRTPTHDPPNLGNILNNLII
jgi:hypothetical protein